MSDFLQPLRSFFFFSRLLVLVQCFETLRGRNVGCQAENRENVKLYDSDSTGVTF